MPWEQASLRKLWCQTRKSSLLPAKCWQLLHIIRGGLMLSLESQRAFTKFAFVLFCYKTNHLITGPLGIVNFVSLEISIFPLRFSRNKIHCSPREQSLSVKLYSETKQKQMLEKRAEIPATTSGHLWSRATVVNISRVTVNCFSFDVIVFAMLHAQGIWREIVSLLDVVWPWTSQWMGTL